MEILENPGLLAESSENQRLDREELERERAERVEREILGDGSDAVAGRGSGKSGGGKTATPSTMDKAAVVRQRALERLRKTQAELRQKIKREKTKKEKRVGGGFLVKFENR